MRLLVSVSSPDEARAAVAGGADIIDAKDPLAGALGAVTLDTLRAIASAVNGESPVSAALGDVTDERTAETAAHTFASIGLSFVKLGFGPVADAGLVASLISAAVRGARTASNGLSRVVAVAYADTGPLTGLAPAALVDVARTAGASGILIDTADKRGPGLAALLSSDSLATLVSRAHDAGLLVALAGRLTADDLPDLHNVGADIAGVRGAACIGGRTGRVSADRVRLLKGCLDFSALDSRFSILDSSFP